MLARHLDAHALQSRSGSQPRSTRLFPIESLDNSATGGLRYS